MGINDVIILDGYGDDQNISWRIETECESLLIESSVFDLEEDFDFLYIEEGDKITSFGSDYDYEISHRTNTGDVTISFQSDYIARKSLKNNIFNNYTNFYM